MLQQVSTPNATLRTMHHKANAVVKQLALIRRIDPSEYISVLKNGQRRHLRIGEILHCEAESNYSSIYHQSGFKVIVPRTLKSLESVLLPTGFLRVHRSHIIQQDAIQQVFTTHIELSNGDSVPLARRYKKRILQRLAETAACS